MLNPLAIRNYLLSHTLSLHASYPRFQILNLTAITNIATAHIIAKDFDTLYTRLEPELQNFWRNEEVVGRIAVVGGEINATIEKDSTEPRVYYAATKHLVRTGENCIFINVKAVLQDFQLHFPLSAADPPLLLLTTIAQREEDADMSLTQMFGFVEYFTGQDPNYSLDNFLSSLNQALSFAPNLQDSQKRDIIALKLRGEARDLIDSEAGLKEGSSANLIKALEARFKPITDDVSAKQAFEACRQLPGETVSKYRYRIVSAATKYAASRPEQPDVTRAQANAMIKADLLTNFVRGLSEPLRQVVRIHMPKTLEEAVEFAQREELNRLTDSLATAATIGSVRKSRSPSPPRRATTSRECPCSAHGICIAGIQSRACFECGSNTHWAKDCESRRSSRSAYRENDRRDYRRQISNGSYHHSYDRDYDARDNGNRGYRQSDNGYNRERRGSDNSRAVVRWSSEQPRVYDDRPDNGRSRNYDGGNSSYNRNYRGNRGNRSFRNSNRRNSRGGHRDNRQYRDGTQPNASRPRSPSPFIQSRTASPVSVQGNGTRRS